MSPTRRTYTPPPHAAPARSPRGCRATAHSGVGLGTLPEADLSVDHRGQILEALARDQIVVVSRAQGDAHHLSQVGHEARQVAKRPEVWVPAIVTERRVGLVAVRLRTDGRRTYRAFEVEMQLYFRQPPQQAHHINRVPLSPGSWLSPYAGSSDTGRCSLLLDVVQPQMTQAASTTALG